MKGYLLRSFLGVKEIKSLLYKKKPKIIRKQNKEDKMKKQNNKEDKMKKQKTILAILFLVSVSALGTQGVTNGVGIGNGSNGQDQVHQMTSHVNPLFPDDLDSYMVYSASA